MKILPLRPYFSGLIIANTKDLIKRAETLEQEDGRPNLKVTIAPEDPEAFQLVGYHPDDTSGEPPKNEASLVQQLTADQVAFTHFPTLVIRDYGAKAQRAVARLLEEQTETSPPTLYEIWVKALGIIATEKQKALETKEKKKLKNS
jgi:hypothetical protein